jgi:hypothetical protein
VKPGLFIPFFLVLSCERPKADSRLELPAREGFDQVSNVLHARCGSLDCHGQPGRNLRLYGKDGLRFLPTDRPGVDGGVTRDREHDENYASVVGLEPELTSDVFRDGGQLAERLTLVRKARGVEAHKGNVAAGPGSDADRCITSWLGGATDAEACAAAAEYLRPRAR